MQFNFFPSPEEENLTAIIRYHPGTPQQQTRKGMKAVEQALLRADAELRGESTSLIQEHYAQLGYAGNTAANYVASVQVELVASEDREIRSNTFIETWQKHIPPLAGLREIIIGESGEGPGGAPIDFALVGDDLQKLKQAADELKAKLALYQGVVSPRDSLEYGRQELLLEVNERGRSLGFTNQIVGRQVRDAFEGAIATRFAREDSEVTVRVLLPRRQNQRQALEQFYLLLPTQERQYIALTEVVTMTEQPGFARIRRTGSGREVRVFAGFASGEGSPDVVTAKVREEVLPSILQRYNVREGVLPQGCRYCPLCQGLHHRHVYGTRYDLPDFGSRLRQLHPPFGDYVYHSFRLSGCSLGAFYSGLPTQLFKPHCPAWLIRDFGE